MTSLIPEVVGALVGLHPEEMTNPLTQLFAYVYFYDLQVGAIEIDLKEDKQGLGMTHHNQKSLLGLFGFIRDVLHINGCAFFDDAQRLMTLVFFNPADPLAELVALTLRCLFSPWDVVVILGKT